MRRSAQFQALVFGGLVNELFSTVDGMTVDGMSRPRSACWRAVRPGLVGKTARNGQEREFESASEGQFAGALELPILILSMHNMGTPVARLAAAVAGGSFRGGLIFRVGHLFCGRDEIPARRGEPSKREGQRRDGDEDLFIHGPLLVRVNRPASCRRE